VTAPEPPPRDPALHPSWVASTAAALRACPNAELLIDRMAQGALGRWRLEEATLWQRVRLRLRADRRALPPRTRAAIPGG
jgi:hypothetical protein